MARFGFVGPSYQSQSVNADAQMCRNWYPEILESQGKSVMALYPTPGLSVFSAALVADGTRPGRGLLTINNRTFAVVGPTLYEIFSSGARTVRGSGIADDGQPVSMAASPQQLLIASFGTAYVLNLQTNAFQTLPAATLTNVSLVGYTDGFFIALLANSQAFQISTALDATSWPPLQIIQVSVFPDNVISMIVDHREIWLGGQKASVGYYDSGSAQIFDVIPGGYIEQGSGSKLAVVRLDNTLFWIGGDERGNAVAWRAQGYTPLRVSNHAVETAWQGYATIADAVAYAYQDQGHAFWVIYFPTANTTWVYDAATGMWHERAYWNTTSGKFEAHRSWNHTFNFAKHLVGDPKSANIYQLSIGVFQDFGGALRRVRRAPHISLEQEWLFHHQLQVDVETGLGPQPPLLDGAGNPRDPQINLRWSDDAGHTWSNEYSVGAGQAGNFRTRAIWRRLGRSRNRVYEVSVSDPIPWRIVDAHLIATPGFAPTERIAKQYSKVT